MASVEKSVDRGKRLRAMPISEYREKLRDQLLRNSQPAPSGCIEWQATCFKNGYGSTRLYGKVTSAHRAAYFAEKGQLAPDLDVCHTCDNRRCVNPAHLFQATHLANMQDMTAKGRRVQGSPNPRRGACNKQSKPVYMAGFVFSSVGEAARALALSKRAIQFRIKAGKGQFLQEQ